MIIFIVVGFCFSGETTIKANASEVLQYNTEYKISELINMASSNRDYKYWYAVEFPSSGRARVVFKNTTKKIMGECALNGAGEVYYDGIENTRSQWFSISPENTGLYMELDTHNVNSEARFILEYQTTSQYTGEVEKNNTYDSANTIQSGLTYEGNLTSADIDVYKFVMAQNGLALIQSSSVSVGRN